MAWEKIIGWATGLSFGYLFLWGVLHKLNDESAVHSATMAVMFVILHAYWFGYTRGKEKQRFKDSYDKYE